MRFSELLTDLRKEYNLSQMQLAEQIGVSQSTIAKLEIGRNEATASTLAKLAAFFDVSTDYLLGLSDEYEGTGKSAPTAPTALPLDESELLRNYRALSYSGKARVAAYIILLHSCCCSQTTSHKLSSDWLKFLQEFLLKHLTEISPLYTYM